MVKTTNRIEHLKVKLTSIQVQISEKSDNPLQISKGKKVMQNGKHSKCPKLIEALKTLPWVKKLVEWTD